MGILAVPLLVRAQSPAYPMQHSSYQLIADMFSVLTPALPFSLTVFSHACPQPSHQDMASVTRMANDNYNLQVELTLQKHASQHLLAQLHEAQLARMSMEEDITVSMTLASSSHETDAWRPGDVVEAPVVWINVPVQLAEQ